MVRKKVRETNYFSNITSFVIYFLSVFLGWIIAGVFGQSIIFVLTIIGGLFLAYLPMIIIDNIFKKSGKKSPNPKMKTLAFLIFLLLASLFFLAISLKLI